MRSADVLYRLDGAGTPSSRSELFEVNLLRQVIVLEGDIIFALTNDQLTRWNGTTLEPIYQPAESSDPDIGLPELSVAARSGSDVWLIETTSLIECTDLLILSDCGEYTSRWRQYAAFHWDGSSMLEAGHVTRNSDVVDRTFFTATTVLPAGPGRVWFDGEGWVEVR